MGRVGTHTGGTPLITPDHRFNLAPGLLLLIYGREYVILVLRTSTRAVICFKKSSLYSTVESTCLVL